MKIRNNKASANPPGQDEIEEYVKSLINLIDNGGKEKTNNNGSSFIEKGLAIAVGSTVGVLISLAYNRKSLTKRVEELEKQVYDKNKK